MTDLGANVSLVPESVAYGETLEDDLLTCDYNIPKNYRAAQSPKLGDSYPEDAAPWGYTVVETGSATSRKSPDQGAFITGVKYARPKVPFESGIENVKEVARKKRTGRRGRRAGQRVFLVPDAMAEALAEANFPELKPMEAEGAWLYALLREKAIDRRWRVGIGRITAYYDTYAPIGEVIYVNKGILEADATAVMMWNKAVVPGTQYRIDEIYWDGGVRKSWVRVQGNNGWPLVKANLRIRAILTASNLNGVKGLVGAVNNAACPKILGAPKGTLWFDKFHMRQRKRGQSTLFDCIIGLAYDPLGWDAETLAQLQKYDIRKEDVFDKTDGVTKVGEQPTGSWVPASTAEPTKMPLPGNEASFAILNGYLS